jgi:TonB-linked SusC/RagA family outer membrane protein
MNQNNFVKKVMTAFLALFITMSGWAQNYTISGNIKDTEGPLPGASVFVKGTQTGTVADIDGNYRINVPNSKAILVFSYVGYVSKEIAVNDRKTVDVLLENNTELDEIVVVGYGTQKKSHLTGALSKITGDDIISASVSDVSRALQGRVAGLTIQNVTSEVGIESEVSIRGTASLSAKGSPLVIVDGIEIENGLSMVNPNDIASIEVLKDAASSAIYGSRAANGVIQIVTKEGSISKPKYTVNLYSGMKWAYKLHDKLTSKEMALLKWDEYQASGEVITRPSGMNKLEAWLEDQNGSTDWEKLALREATFINNLSFSVSGGTQSVRYYISSRLINDEGIMKDNEVNRINVFSKIDASLSTKVKVGISSSMSYAKQKSPVRNFFDYYRFPSGMPPYHNTFTSAITGKPVGSFTYPPDFNGMSGISILPGDVDANGNPVFITDNLFGSTNKNPLDNLSNTSKSNENFQANGNVYLEAKLGKHLTFKTTNGYNGRFRPSYAYNNKGAINPGNPARASSGMNWALSLITENMLTYARKIDKHDINLIGVYSYEYKRNENMLITGVNYPTDLIHTLYSATEFERTSSSGRMSTGSVRLPNEGLESYLSRIMYSYADKYLLSASIRLDRSSLFKSDRRNAWFPSVSLGWRVTEEDFMRSTEKWLSNLKLRNSYGVTGNKNVNAYATTNLYSNKNYINGEGSGQQIAGLGNTYLTAGNPNLTWEQADQFNAGVDIGFLRNRFNLTMDLYYGVTRTLVFEQPAQSFSGFQYQWNNIGRIRNKGIELSLETFNIKNHYFSWSTTFNYLANRSRVLELGGESRLISTGTQGEQYITEVGYPLIRYYGYKTVGVWDSYEQIDSQPHHNQDVPGGLMAQNTNGDESVNDRDYVPIGNPSPDFTWGITNTFKYKNFDFSFLIQGVQGWDIYNSDGVDRLIVRYNRKWVENRWAGPNNRGNGMTPYESYGLARAYTDNLIQDASYACLRNLTFGYTFPQKISKNFGLNELRVYGSGNNLLYIWKDEYFGIDPEARYTYSPYDSPLMAGYQSGGFPITSTFTVGIDITF